MLDEVDSGDELEFCAALDDKINELEYTLQCERSRLQQLSSERQKKEALETGGGGTLLEQQFEYLARNGTLQLSCFERYRDSSSVIVLRLHLYHLCVMEINFRDEMSLLAMERGMQNCIIIWNNDARADFFIRIIFC